jgi:hypothetical protein
MKRNRRRDPEANEQDEAVALRPKTVWHPLTLQHLKPSQFIDIVNRILDGRYELFQGTLKDASGRDIEERIEERLVARAHPSRIPVTNPL